MRHPTLVEAVLQRRYQQEMQERERVVYEKARCRECDAELPLLSDFEYCHPCRARYTLVRSKDKRKANIIASMRPCEVDGCTAMVQKHMGHTRCVWHRPRRDRDRSREKRTAEQRKKWQAARNKRRLLGGLDE